MKFILSSRLFMISKHFLRRREFTGIISLIRNIMVPAEIFWFVPLSICLPIFYSHARYPLSPYCKLSSLWKRIWVPQDCLVACVQLGAGKINSIESDLQRVIRLLNEHENLYVVGESLIGNRIDVSGERIRIIRDYPNHFHSMGLILQ